jgi:hypothetical protein
MKYLLIATILCLSCTSVKKNKNSSSSSAISETKNSTDSIAVINTSDSNSYDSLSNLQEEDNNTVLFKFDTSKYAANFTGQVFIDKSGVVNISSNVPLKSLSLSRNKKRKKEQLVSKNNLSAKTDSSNKKKIEQSIVSTKTEVKSKQKEVVRNNFVSILLVIVTLITSFIILKHLKKNIYG